MVGVPTFEIIIDREYPGFNPVQFGYEDCRPGHAVGPGIRTHWLLHYVVWGKGIFCRDGVTHEVRPGDIFVIPPYEETYYEADRENPWRYIWIGFVTREQGLTEVFSKPVIRNSGAKYLFEDMIRCRNLENGRSAYLSGKVWELASLLLDRGKPDTDYVQKAMHLMNSEYMNGVSVAEVATRLNLNRTYFSTRFKESAGLSPQQYLIRLRMEKAAELMVVRGEKPSVAAASVGYGDIFHFSKAFKQYFGISPRQYSEQYRKEVHA